MADATIRPVSAGTGNWDVTTVANINEAITQPSTAGDGTYARHHGSSTKIQEWNLTAPSDAGTITGVVVWLRVSCEEDGDNEMSVRIKVNGTWHSLSNSDGSVHDYNEWRQYTGTFSGGAMVGSAPVLEVTGAGTSSSSRGYLHNAYGLLAYTPAPAEQYAVKNGNYNDPTVWSTTAVPTTGTVYSNGFDVTVNVNSSATVVTSVAGTVAVAGGGFFLANGVTLTANCYAGAGHGVSITGNGFAANVIGDVYGSSTTTNRYGAIASANNSVLTVTGNAYGGSQVNSSGVGSTSTTSTVNLIGNAYGGTGSGAAGARATGGTLNVTGNGYGSDSGSGQGVYYSGSTASGTITGHLYGSNSYGGSILSAGTLTVNGNTVGGVNASADGLYVASSANVTVTGSSTGGVSTSATSYGIEHAGTGLVTVATAISSAKAAGVHNGTAGGTLTVESVVTDASGTSPCSGKVSVTDLSAFTALVRSSSSSATLSAEVGLPSPFEPSPVFGGA